MNTTATDPTFQTINNASEWLQGRIIGQQTLIQRLLMALLCGGHLLVESSNIRPAFHGGKALTRFGGGVSQAGWPVVSRNGVHIATKLPDRRRTCNAI